MVTDATRRAAWNAMLDVARFARYYDALFGRYQRRCNAVRFMILVAAINAAAMPLGLPVWAAIGISSLASIVVAFDFVMDYYGKAAALRFIKDDLGALDGELAALWLAIESGSMDEKEAQTTLTALLRRMHNVTARGDAAGLATRARLNEECQEAAFAVVARQYGS